jgi:hypothetical protein
MLGWTLNQLLDGPASIYSLEASRRGKELWLVALYSMREYEANPLAIMPPPIIARVVSRRRT